ncbi:MAG: hypothetical protein ORN57_02250 [Alphaproteobacteria bacterium]|nr:hypothetical protein [Alphaproteobacteria bacterium]
MTWSLWQFVAMAYGSAGLLLLVGGLFFLLYYFRHKSAYQKIKK